MEVKSDMRTNSVSSYKIFASVCLATVCLITSANSLADTSLLDAVKTRGTVRIGIGYQTPPMNFLDDKGEPAGFDIDLAHALADKMGVKPEFVQVNNKTRITFLSTGQVDMVLSNINHTIGRDRQVDFSDTYLKDGKRILAKKGYYKTLRDFVGKRIAVTQGSNAQQAVAEALKALGDKSPKVMSFQNESECFLALKTGKVDGYTNDTVILVATTNGDRSYEPVGEIYSPTYYGVAVPEDQSKWRDEINFTLRDLYLNGTYQKIYGKWFGAHAKYPLPASSGQLDVWAD